MNLSRENHCSLVGVVRHLEAALAILDEFDVGDGEGAAEIERALQRAKRALRQPGSTLPPLPRSRRPAGR
jgi:hypothetical protein